MDRSVIDRIDIAEVKARYCRLLDTKDWQGFTALFTEDFVHDGTASGGHRVEGRANVVDMTRSSIGDAKTVHQVHTPEYHFVDDNKAEVIWPMQDRIVWAPERAAQIGFSAMTGWGHYHELYLRQPDGRWLIAEQRLTRLHMDMQPFVAGEA